MLVVELEADDSSCPMGVNRFLAAPRNRLPWTGEAASRNRE